MSEFGLVQLEGGCRLTLTNAEFDDSMPFELWLKNGQKLCAAGGASMWWVGAWVNAGAKMYLKEIDGSDYHLGDGAKYQRAMELSGYENDTLRAAAWVERSVPLCNRLHTLSWSHHREVAHLEAGDQRKFLHMAQDQGWTRSQLRQAIRKDKATELEEPIDVGPVGFILSKPVGDIMRWFKVQLRETPIEDMSKERREVLKRELRPIVDVYEALEAKS